MFSELLLCCSVVDLSSTSRFVVLVEELAKCFMKLLSPELKSLKALRASCAMHLFVPHIK